MATSVSFNGTTYSVPASGERNWSSLSSYLIAIASGALSKAGGSFTLTSADVDFGATYGLKAAKFASRSTPSTTGIFRLGNAEYVAWRNAANSADLGLRVNSSNVLEFNGNPLLTLALGSGDTTLIMNSGGTAYSWAKITNALVDAGAGIVYSKLNLGASVVNADIGASAAIAYSKLNLSGSLVNADVHASAGIVYTKLNLSGSLVNADVHASAAIAYSKLNLSTSIVNADISGSAAIAYSKLNLATSIVNGDINASAGIVYTKLNLSGSLVNADVHASAAIAYSKLNLAASIATADLASGLLVPLTKGGTGQTTANAALNALLPSQGGNSGKVLGTNATDASWVSVATTVTTTRGDLIRRGAAIDERVALGTKGFKVTSDGTDAVWGQGGQATSNRITAGYTVLDADGYRNIIVTTAPATLVFSSRSSDTITFSASHGMVTGTPIYFSGSGTPPTGLTLNLVNYAIVTGATTAKFATTIANAIAGTAITLSGDGASQRQWECGVGVVLPTAADNADRTIVIKKAFATSAQMVAVIPEAAGETIDGEVGVTLCCNGDGVSVVASGGFWYHADNYFQSYMTRSFVEGDVDSTGFVKVVRNGGMVVVDASLTMDGTIGTSGTQAQTAIVPAFARPSGTIGNIFAFSTSTGLLTRILVANTGTVSVLQVDIDTNGDLANANATAAQAFRGTICYTVL